ncbi:hypothetical protein [Mycobacterium botniense]|nr:hypothetical protein [Mycobacterium botniense]
MTRAGAEAVGNHTVLGALSLDVRSAAPGPPPQARHDVVAAA